MAFKNEAGLENWDEQGGALHDALHSAVEKADGGSHDEAELRSIALHAAISAGQPQKAEEFLAFLKTGKLKTQLTNEDADVLVYGRKVDGSYAAPDEHDRLSRAIVEKYKLKAE